MCKTGGPPCPNYSGQPIKLSRTTRILLLIASHSGVAAIAATAATGAFGTATVSALATAAVLFTLRELNL